MQTGSQGTKASTGNCDTGPPAAGGGDIWEARGGPLSLSALMLPLPLLRPLHCRRRCSSPLIIIVSGGSVQPQSSPRSALTAARC